MFILSIITDNGKGCLKHEMIVTGQIKLGPITVENHLYANGQTGFIEEVIRLQEE